MFFYFHCVGDAISVFFFNYFKTFSRSFSICLSHNNFCLGSTGVKWVALIG